MAPARKRRSALPAHLQPAKEFLDAVVQMAAESVLRDLREGRLKLKKKTPSRKRRSM
jgi:hypothetical protein